MTSQHQAIPILLSRPAAQSDRFAADLQRRFGTAVRAVISPVMTLRFLDPEFPDGRFDTLILTSESGVEAAVRLQSAGKPLPSKALCVGDRTAAVAAAAGFAAQSAQGDAEALIARVMDSADVGPFLHLRGREARGDIAPRLAAKGRPAKDVIVYEQVQEPLGKQAREILNGRGPVVVPVFSPRSARLLADQGPFAAGLWVVAISQAAADAASALAPVRVVLAERPDATAMLEAIGRIISEPAS